MSTADVVAAVLWTGVTLYAVFGGADFGAGFWTLVARGGERGQRARALIAWAIGPVWESNHVWLIFVLVVLWTGFPEAFASIMSTLFIPLSLAALGIVLRGAGFAFQGVAARERGRRLATRAFALSSVLTPFFMGTVAGAVASGRVPIGNAKGDPVTSWVNPVSLLIGVLFVAAGAYLAAVFLASDARRFGDPDLERYFATRALGAAVAAGIVAVAGIFVLHADARYIYDGLVDEGLPLVIASVVFGAAALLLALARRPARRPRPGGGRRRRGDLGLGGRAVPLPAAREAHRRGRRRGQRDADRLARRLRCRPGLRRARAGAALHARPANGAGGGGGAVIAPSGEQIEIVHGDQRAVVVEVGGGLREYTLDGRNVLDGYGADEMSSSGRGQVLIPWPNRIQDGRYSFDGQEHQLPLDDVAEQDAIHGLVRWGSWIAGDRAENRVVMEHALHPQPGYPFSLALSVEYLLSDEGLLVRTTATNRGPRPCPYGSGNHPYLTVSETSVDSLTLRVPAHTLLRSDERGIPVDSATGEGTEYDFRRPRADRRDRAGPRLHRPRARRGRPSSR